MAKNGEFWPALNMGSLLIGNASLDQEHAELFRILEKMWRLTPSYDQSDEFFDLLSVIGLKIHVHFAHEEAFISTLSLPGDQVRSHVVAHNEIVEQYTQLNLDIMCSKVPERQRIVGMVRNWIYVHLIKHDLRLTSAIAQAREDTKRIR